MSAVLSKWLRTLASVSMVGAWVPRGAGLGACLFLLACQPIVSTGVTGVVQDKLTGLPAANIKLYIVGYKNPVNVPTDGYQEWTKNNQERSTVTDSQGRFSFTVESEGRYSLEANPAGGTWVVPNKIQLEIPAPRHPQFIDLVKGQVLDLGTVYAKNREDVAQTYGPVCDALQHGKKVQRKLDFDFVVLGQSKYAPSGWYSDSELERGLLQNWRPATPTLICVVSHTSYAGVYQEQPSMGSDRLTADPLNPYSAFSVSQRVYVLDRDGVESILLSSAPPPTTTTPLDTMTGQERQLRWSLYQSLRKR